MRILVLSWRGPLHPMAGGAEQVMHEHMKGWVEAGHKVDLFVSAFKGGVDNEMIDGVRVIRKGRQIFGVHLSAALYYLFGRHGRYDVVIDQFHGIPFFTNIYVRKPKLAVVQEVARKVWLKNELPKPFSWIVGVIGYLGEPFVFLSYKGIEFMTGSESAREDLVRVGISRKRITVVPHGVIVKKPKPFPRKERVKTVLFLGAVTRDKGIEDAMETFSILDEKGEYRFWVVGKASTYYKDYLKREARKAGISERFTYHGFVSLEKKFELYARAHVLINPSILEGFGLVNIEANSVGTPVVAYKSKGLVDSVKAAVSGEFCSENTPESMAETVHGLVYGRRYGQMQKTAMAWSRRFSWRRSKELSLKLIERVART